MASERVFTLGAADGSEVIDSYSRIGMLGGSSAEPKLVSPGPTTMVPRGMILTSLKLSTSDASPTPDAAADPPRTLLPNVFRHHL